MALHHIVLCVRHCSVSPISDEMAHCRLYTLVSSFYLVALGFMSGAFPNATNAWEFIKEFVTSTNGVILIALASTFGTYIVASLLYFDPWHLLTSMVQYLLMATSYVNILNVYAFCNWHDVSWGTKGADKADALPSAQTTKKSDTEGGASVEVLEYELPQADIDSKFEKVVKKALMPYKEPKKDTSRSLDDAYKNFRTKLIITWIFTYCSLISFVADCTGTGSLFCSLRVTLSPDDSSLTRIRKLRLTVILAMSRNVRRITSNFSFILRLCCLLLGTVPSFTGSLY